jgi:hypothetical protein
MVEYDLSSINGINAAEIFSDNNTDNIDKLKLIHKHWIQNDKPYNILKYDRKNITYDMFDSTGLFRSVIYSNKKINVFSPPKALNISVFINKYKAEDCVVEEFIEGTMINLFYDSDVEKWEIASKSSIGGNVTFFKDQPTFSDLFYDVCNELKIDFANFSKEYCYSFIMQHPKNKFVRQINEKKLYLITCYKIDNNTYKVTEIPRHFHTYTYENMSFPEFNNFESFNELLDKYGSMNTNCNIMGVVIHHKSGIRTKIRNPNYEYLKHLRGNSSKLQYQYLCLRKMGQVKDNLRFFPDNKAQFKVFKIQLHMFTDNLYTNYIKCYMKKDKPLTEFPKQFRTHMFNLHKYYLYIKPYGGYINKSVVINYINNLDSAKLMYSLNFHLRDAVQIDQNTANMVVEEVS